MTLDPALDTVEIYIFPHKYCDIFNMELDNRPPLKNKSYFNIKPYLWAYKHFCFDYYMIGFFRKWPCFSPPLPAVLQSAVWEGFLPMSCNCSFVVLLRRTA